jgi:hypothetical protein
MEQPQPHEQTEETADIDTGSEIVSREQVVLVEPFNAEDHPNIRTRGTHTSRVVLLRRSFLAPEPPEHFVKVYGFVSIEKDGVAINPDHIPKDPHEDDFFHVRRFVQDPNKPPLRKGYKSELFWDGGFIRLETEPKIVRAVLRPKKAEQAPAQETPRESPSQPRPQRRRRGIGFGPRAG